MFEPNSHEDMADKVWSLWSSESQRQRVRAMGFERVKIFNWEETARKTLAVYRKAVGAI
jgi:glycosyltransferase involved in cell wall biosynthesis